MCVHVCAYISVCVARVALDQNMASPFHCQFKLCVVSIVFHCVSVCECDIALHEKRKELPTNKKDTDRGGNKDKRNKRGFQDTPALI